jgi:hypothetical protein
MIDADIVELEEEVSGAVNTVSDLEDRAVHVATTVENSEIQNIAPSRYLKTTDDGTGFECVDGGGDEGGKVGQNSVKKSDENYDTGWGDLLEVSKKGMTVQQNAENAKPNQTHIYNSDAEIENSEQLPKADLANQQIAGDAFAERNESFILRDSIEQNSDAIQIASRKNYGLVKLGDGIDIVDGKITGSSVTLASKENFGLVKLGEGINDDGEAISVQSIGVASTSAFGVVKLGADFALNANGAMEVVKGGDEEMVIYDLAKKKIVNNGIVDLEENIAIYRAFLNDDLIFSFNMNFEPQADFSFWLEIISDGEHVIDFAEEILGGIFGVNRGITRIKFTKLLGAQKWNADVDVLEAPEPVLLTPNNGDNIKSDLLLSCNGSAGNTCDMMGTDVGDISFQNNPREIYFEFAKSAVVDSVYFFNNNNNALSLFELLASNDKINWTRLLYKTDSVVEKNTPTERKGAFHHFKLRFSNEANVRGIQLWGSPIENDDSELILLTPQMGSNSVAGITISCSSLTWGELRNMTSPAVGSGVEVANDTDGEVWIQYEFSESKIANFLDLSAFNNNLNETPRWFKLIASDDGEEWDLLLEREYQEDWRQGEGRYFEFGNTTAYKFYRFVSLYTSQGSSPPRCLISRFRLFRRESGTSLFVNCLPPLIAASQDGYEVSANSIVDSGYAAINAFDDREDTQWATAAGDQNNSWLKIKLPEATAFSAAFLQARSDGYYFQAPSAFKVQGSNDDETWTDLTHEAASWAQKEAKSFYWLNETPYLYYRLLIESVQSGAHAALAKFSLGIQAKTYTRYLNKYDYLVPVLTSDNDNGYVATCSSYLNETHLPYKAFNRQTDVNSKWVAANGDTAGAWLKIELPTAAAANSFSVASPDEGYTGRMPSSFKIQGSNDNSSWTDLLVVSSLSWGSNERKFWNVENETAYKFYRLLIVANSENLAVIGDWGILAKSIITEY